MSIVVSVARLHDMVVRDPFQRALRISVHRGRIDGYRPIVGDASPALALSDKQLGIETPRNHRVHDKIVVAVDIYSFRHREELALATRKSGSKVQRWLGSC